jgi:hypothetical protein
MSAIVIGAVPRLAPVIHADSVSVVNPTADRNTLEFEYETTMSYRNGLAYPIKVVHRNGFAVIIPPLPSGLKSTSDFVVEVMYTYTKKVILDTNHILGVVNERTRPEVAALNLAVANTRPVPFKQGNAFILKYVVHRDTLDVYGREVQIDDLDITVSADLQSVDIKHPDSLEGRLIKIWDAIDKSFQYRLDIVDPKQVFGDRYINIGGIVYRVFSCDDISRPHGVYHYTKERRVHEIYEDQGAGYEYMSFEEADARLPWYRTHVEAEIHGDISAANKLEIETRKHELALRSQELDALAQENRLNYMTLENESKELQFNRDQEILTLKERLESVDSEHKRKLVIHKAEVLRLEAIATEKEAALAKEKHDRERVMMEERHRYESRSMDRKDSSEIVKWIPAVIGGGFLLAKFLL